MDGVGDAAEGNPGHYRMPLGDFELIALHDGVLVRDFPPGFVRNVPDAAVGDALEAAGMARDKLTITFTALAVRTGNGVVLIDTGLGNAGPPGTGRVLANLAAAGIGAEEVSTVLISHFHSDHIAGLVNFPNAQVMVPQEEWDFWTDANKRSAAPEALKPHFDLVQRVLVADQGRVRRFAWGQQPLPGFTSVAAGGHTPGMSAFAIESQGESVLFVADVTNNPLLFVRNPTWQAMFDFDPVQATETRIRLLDQAAASRQLLFFFHAPFPGFGTVVKRGAEYEYLPSLWR